ncbi:hypothetical protein ASPSYDRAFT_158264 [Aspergillus sydowii CBS 593.65]|uniref:ferric-chelate reductase (NADPH) n=1 Tax=Aspergillus sydowii CBS 593.65 TaxID=1036612 RepID=A0A1L9T8E5_9EURO|nr:uncharacterized protein ASPSYDRAFT_158264 [Aspergillus sydowii CBS 593.65]OJJ55710.1 hypothetical protein ASPSYDRAFT_158264 [Aspergillus sydowii CBS 593.65]
MDMDMGQSSGLPWLDSPVMLHSSRADTCKMTPEQCAYRSGHWRYWYKSDLVYALNTVYFLCATVGVFAILHFAGRYAPARVRQNSLWKKGTAAARFLAYRGVRIPGLGYWAASLGVAVLLLIGAVFFLAMTLGPKPYYWPSTSYGGSPPIATRTGWMAVALLPFVLVLGTKANLISALTGVPHEKLQVFHHWTSYAMFVLALIHTFPFIVLHIQEGDMVSEWNTSLVYWTGVAALIPQAYLTFMSLPAIRNRYYEFFKATHFIVALLFILFFFFHCDFRLSSWDYFIAAGSLYIFSLLTSLIRTHLINGRHTATLTLLPCGLLQIKIPTIINWTPGQHVFIRFSSPRTGIALHSLTSHPFTICSTSHDVQKANKANEMIFYVKPKRGITGRLANIATKLPGSGHSVLVEGPYGGIEPTNIARSESVVIISGGSGGGFSLAVFETALQMSKTDCRDSNQIVGDAAEKGKKTITVVFATQSEDVAQWYREQIKLLLALHGVGAEGKSVDPLSSSSEALSETHNANANTSANAFAKGRPDLPRIVASSAESSTGKHVAVFVCGPASMLNDVRNAAAREQERILRGGAGGEVYLHSESFS